MTTSRERRPARNLAQKLPGKLGRGPVMTNELLNAGHRPRLDGDQFTFNSPAPDRDAADEYLRPIGVNHA